MQDKGQPTVDTRLVDRAWADMEQRLKAEMPQKRRWFPWLLLLLPIGLVASWCYFNLPTAQETAQLTPPQVAVTEAVAATTPASTLATADNDERTPTPTQAFVTKEERNEGNTDQRSVATSSIQDNGMANTSGTSPLTPTPPQDISRLAENNRLEKAIVKEVIADEVAPSTVIPQASVNRRFPAQETSNPIPQKLDLANVTSPVATLLSTVESAAATSSPLINPITATPASTGKFRPYAEVLGAHELSQPLGSWGAGVGLEYELSRRSVLDLGLGFQRSLAIFSQDDNDLISRGPGFQSGSNYDPSYSLPSNVSVPLSFTRYQVQLSYRYRFGSRWQLGVGIAAAYYQRGAFQLQPPSEALGLDETQNTDQEIDFYTQEVGLLNFDELRNTFVGPTPWEAVRWQWAGTAQATYQFNRHWAANVFYRQDLSAWPNKAFDNNRAASLGVGL
ncbi:MAG: hypothetical protein AAGJ82_12180, partial [Bacteroidota bacterium]